MREPENHKECKKFIYVLNFRTFRGTRCNFNREDFPQCKLFAQEGTASNIFRCVDEEVICSKSKKLYSFLNHRMSLPNVITIARELILIQSLGLVLRQLLQVALLMNFTVDFLSLYER